MPNRFNPDADLIRRLAEVINQTGLTEIEYAEGDRRIRVARNITAQSVVMQAGAPGASLAAPIGTATGAADDMPANAVVSPMVGTVYLSPEPGAAPFAKPGDRVSEGQTLLIIEAMKVMNPIKSPRAGTVKAVLIQNAEPVEYGQPLIVVE
jgi:acetyl-CoA carboxylase biotin carboxyl carrier protein